MTLEITIILLGILIVIISLFIPSKTKQLSKDMETISLEFYQDQHQVKRRLKAIEEELMLTSPPAKVNAPVQAKPIHDILINQVKALHQQGYSVKEISARSSLTNDQIKSIIGGR
ncbi:hypothetical protein [Paenisporosarcina cavernae]|uniref:Resolvase HTH domain-containing protein n=1 Tax=Paenisporosarcina cavernae TaxID=2320858 RepID=A0A385YSS1_9BACL|nr:hypothetical protein [Paenisporosarcina cavernae]AYC29574.1 hypothetical protein D3873_06635 [Paenisporosarcina cavernae]